MSTENNATGVESSGTDMEATWRRFGAHLEDLLASLSIGQRTLLGPHVGPAPNDEPTWAAVHRYPRGLLLTVPRNTFPMHRQERTLAGLRELRRWGLPRPQPNSDYEHFLPAGIELNHASQAICIALREGFGVVHPSALVVPDLGLDPGHDWDSQPPPSAEVVAPHDRSHLVELVDRGVKSLRGELEVGRQQDLWGLCNDQASVVISIDPTAPTLEFDASAIWGIEHGDIARQLLTELSRRHPGTTLCLDGDRIAVRVSWLVEQFSEQALAATIQHVADVATLTAELLLPQVGGESFPSSGDGGRLG